MMTLAQNKIKNIIKEWSMAEAVNLDDDFTIKLGLDSSDIAEIMIDIEEEFYVLFEEDFDPQTPRDCYDEVYKLRKGFK